MAMGLGPAMPPADPYEQWLQQQPWAQAGAMEPPPMLAAAPPPEDEGYPQYLLDAFEPPPPTEYGFGDRFAMGMQAGGVPRANPYAHGADAFLQNLLTHGMAAFAAGRMKQLSDEEREKKARSEAGQRLAIGRWQAERNRANAVATFKQQLGRDALARGDRLADRSATTAHQAEVLAETKRHNQATEATARANAGKGEGLKPPAAIEREKLIQDAQLLGQTDVIESLFKPEYVGPTSGARWGMASVTGLGAHKGEADFRAALALYRNAVINALSGAAVSGQEQIRMQQQIPQEGDRAENFIAKLRQTRDNIRRVAQARRDLFAQTGVDLTGVPALPGMAPAAAPAPVQTSAPTTPAQPAGRTAVKRVERWGRDANGNPIFGSP